PVLVAVHEQPKGRILSLCPSALKPHQAFVDILGPSLAKQQHEAEIVLRFSFTLFGGEPIPARGFCEVFGTGTVSGCVHNAKRSLCVDASELTSAQEFPFELRARFANA